MKINLVAVALLAAVLAGCQQPTMQEFQSRAGGFTVLMPGTPIEKTTTLNFPFGRTDSYSFSVDKGEEGVYSVDYCDYPESHVQERSAEAMLDGARDGGVAAVGGKLLFETIISLNGYPGREIEVEIAGGEGRVTARIFLVGRRLYTVLWAGPTEKAFLKRISEFFDSFQLLEK